jgi:hypothetical protein
VVDLGHSISRFFWTQEVEVACDPANWGHAKSITSAIWDNGNDLSDGEVRKDFAKERNTNPQKTTTPKAHQPLLPFNDKKISEKSTRARRKRRKK